jgi:hypothetical protein
LGQLDEKGLCVVIKHGLLRIWDTRRRLLAKVSRGSNRLYVLHTEVAQPLCLAARRNDDVCRWHVEQFCDTCVLVTQWRLPFPHQTSFRAKEKLELVHGGLCGPITPATPGGRRYFLLVDDVSR